MTVYESLKRPEDMTLEEANAEYDRLYDFLCPSTADWQRMARCSRRISELKYGGGVMARPAKTYGDCTDQCADVCLTHADCDRCNDQCNKQFGRTPKRTSEPRTGDPIMDASIRIGNGGDFQENLRRAIKEMRGETV